MKARLLRTVKTHYILVIAVLLIALIATSALVYSQKSRQQDIASDAQTEQATELETSDVQVAETVKITDTKNQKNSKRSEETKVDPEAATPKQSNNEPSCVKSSDGYCYLVRNAQDRQQLAAYEKALKEQPAKIAKAKTKYNACKTAFAGMTDLHEDYFKKKAECERLRALLAAAKTPPVKPFLGRVEN